MGKNIVPLLVILSFWTLGSLGEEPLPSALGPEESFQQGVTSYFSAQYEEAARHFKQTLATQPDNAQALYNWGLSEYQLGHKGLAVGSWRRALAISPSLSEARLALAFALDELQIKRSNLSGWDRWRERVLDHFSLEQGLLLTAVLLLLSGYLLIRYWGRRRRALQSQAPLPAWPRVGFVLGVLAALSMTLALLKGFDLLTPRATVIVNNLAAKSAPNENSSTLFEVREGSDVVLRQRKKGWTQIRSPGGMAGWVQEDTLFHSSGMSIW